MKLTLYTADCTGDATNCVYPNRAAISTKTELVGAVAHDQVFARYKNSYRNIDNFLDADVIPMDCDNDHSENTADWYSAEKLEEIFEDVDHIIIPSRNHMRPKSGKPARPRLHILFPIPVCSDAVMYAAIKSAIQKKYDFFDDNALDAARFFYGAVCTEDTIAWHEGFLSIDETLEESDYLETEVDKQEQQISLGGPIMEGSRNNTMSHYAGRVLKKFGVTEKAHDLYMERATKCEPPLPEQELNTIWKSAVKFAKKVQEQEGYVPPDDFNDEFGSCSLKPDDYSDIGEAKVLSAQCAGNLRYTSATDYITFDEDHWHEDKQKSLGAVEDFMDYQLLDATEAVRIAEENLIAIGIDEADVKARGKDLEKIVPESKKGLLFALVGADTYKKFVMKYRNYKKLVDTQNAAKPMLAIDVSELDYDPELLNAPDLTYDLTKGLLGGRPHDPDDLITKVTSCSPGDKGRQLWSDTLDTFFCHDRNLVSYVQQIVGMAAVGRVYAEQICALQQSHSHHP